MQRWRRQPRGVATQTGVEAGARPRQLPPDLRHNMDALRWAVLHAATSYGLSATVGTVDPDTVDAWRAWLSWYGTLVAVLEQELDDPTVSRHLMPSAELLQAVAHFGSDDSGATFDSFANPEFLWVFLLETLEAFARRVQRYGVAPLAEGRSVERVGTDLLGTLEDSLILLSFGNDEDRYSCAGSAEVYELLRAGRDDKAFANVDVVPGLVLPVLSVPIRVGPSTDDDWSAIVEFLKQAAETVELYTRLEPHGQELDDQHRVEVENRIRAGVISMRSLAWFKPDTEVPTDNGLPSPTLRSMLWRMRSMHRSFVLALSDDPDHRSLAMSLEELRDPTTAGNRYLHANVE